MCCGYGPRHEQYDFQYTIRFHLVISTSRSNSLIETRQMLMYEKTFVIPILNLYKPNVFLWDIFQLCRFESDAAERGV